MWKRYISPTPANVARLMIGAKTVLVSIAGAEMISGNPKLAFWVLLGTGILNEVASFLTSKPKEDDNTSDK